MSKKIVTNIGDIFYAEINNQLKRLFNIWYKVGNSEELGEGYKEVYFRSP